VRQKVNTISHERYYDKNQKKILSLYGEFAIYKVCGKDDYYSDHDLQTVLEYLLEMGKAQLDMPAKFLTEPLPQVEIIIDASTIKLFPWGGGHYEKINSDYSSTMFIYHVVTCSGVR
jgi:hypothetical protein